MRLLKLLFDNCLHGVGLQPSKNIGYHFYSFLCKKKRKRKKVIFWSEGKNYSRHKIAFSFSFIFCFCEWSCDLFLNLNVNCFRLCVSCLRNTTHQKATLFNNYIVYKRELEINFHKIILVMLLQMTSSRSSRQTLDCLCSQFQQDLSVQVVSQ